MYATVYFLLGQYAAVLPRNDDRGCKRCTQRFDARFRFLIMTPGWSSRFVEVIRCFAAASYSFTCCEDSASTWIVEFVFGRSGSGMKPASG